MMMTEVENVLTALRLQKAMKRKERVERAKHEPRMVLSEEEKQKMIANNAAAMREDKEDCAKWIELKKQHTKNVPTQSDNSQLFRVSLS